MTPTRIAILGKDDIIVDHGLWIDFVAEDLLTNTPSSTYVLVTDTNLVPIYVPSFNSAFERVVTATCTAPAIPRLLTYAVAPGESSKSRATKAEIEDWML